MHRLATIPGDDSPEDLTFVEQQIAPVIFLTTTTTDIACLSSTLTLSKHHDWKGRIRALSLMTLRHPAQIDHYITSSTQKAKIILVRLLGSKGHWSYGLEKLQNWMRESSDRNLIVISGTKEYETELNSIGNIDDQITSLLSDLLSIGGVNNMTKVLAILNSILEGEEINHKIIRPTQIEDPLKWDWNNDEGDRVGVILYRALFKY